MFWSFFCKCFVEILNIYYIIWMGFEDVSGFFNLVIKIVSFEQLDDKNVGVMFE